MDAQPQKTVITRVFSTQSDENQRAFGALHELAEPFMAAVLSLERVVREGGKILFCGNGGSASSASHMVNDCVGHMYVDRAPIPAVSIADNASVLTALSNDYGYASIFERQVDALGAPGDALVAISTSGSSENVVRATRAATQRGIVVLGLTGRDGGALRTIADHWLPAATDDPVAAEHVHLFVLHTLTEALEAARFPNEPAWRDTKGVNQR